LEAKVYIRADASPEIGLGHLVRCIALANMLKKAFKIIFVCNKIPENLTTEITSDNFLLLIIESEDHFLGEIKKEDIVVLDGYHFDTRYQKKIKSIGCKLVCIDDLHDKDMVADLIINHVPGVGIHDYTYYGNTRFALGPAYALLRPEFLVQAQRERQISKIESVLICFGGSDSNNFTYKVLSLLVTFPVFKNIIVVTGGSYLYKDSLETIKDMRVVCYHNIGSARMAELMFEAELAIVPASGILYECLALKNIVITGMYIENQFVFLREFSKFNNVFNCSTFTDANIKAALNKVFQSTYKQSDVIDGNSGKRLLNLFCELK
jgi:UDP-2,4-diacetamido-2,4,6-trideoxy-beta-L-altropyranose hydrolase